MIYLKKSLQATAGSVMHHIAQAFAANTTSEFTQLMGSSRRFLNDLISQLYLAHDQDLIATQSFRALYKRCVKTRASVEGFLQNPSLAESVYLIQKNIHPAKTKFQKGVIAVSAIDPTKDRERGPQ